MKKETWVELIHSSLEDRTLNKKQIREVVDATITVMRNTLLVEEEFSIQGFGTFKVKERAGREGRNPKTGESLSISACRVLSFKPSSVIKADLNAN